MSKVQHKIQNLAKYFSYFDALQKKCDSNAVSKSPSTFGEYYLSLLKNAKKFDTSAIRNIAYMLWKGEYFDMDKPQAKDIMYDLAFHNNQISDPHSAYLYARFCLDEGKFQDFQHILYGLIKKDFFPAHALLGNSYHYGNGVKVNYVKAASHYQKAIQKGHAPAKVLRAKLLMKNRNPFKLFWGLVLWVLAIAHMGVIGAKDNVDDIRLIY